jgi:2-hydroxyacyl-CoA lyase 1
MLTGSQYLAKLLVASGVKHVYGVVGIPITSFAEHLLAHGMPFLGFRNEQAASYAASVDAFLHGNEFPGVLLTVSGPGFVHALAGIINAKENGWPLLVIVATPTKEGRSPQGEFQEYSHEELVKGWTKFITFSTNSRDLVRNYQELIDHTRPRLNSPAGISILQISRGWLESNIAESVPLKIEFTLSTIPVAGPFNVAREMIATAQRPLIVFGKGAAFGVLDELAIELVNTLGIPFITMPMAKGLVPENHPLDMAAARSLAFANADLIIMVGARSNWMLPIHKLLTEGLELKIVRIDVCERDELLSDYRDRVFNLTGQCRDVVSQLLKQICNIKFDNFGWIQVLKDQVERNKHKLKLLIQDLCLPLTYHPVYSLLNEYITPETILITEGSTTMDVARVMLSSNLPRHRLDAGTFATMGVGMPYTIAASLKGHNVMYVAGDSAFGFSMAEVETAVRYRLTGITVIVMNNSGIYEGIEREEYQMALTRMPPLLPSTALTPDTRYDRLSEMFPDGIQGFHVETLQDLRHVLSHKDPQRISLINVHLRAKNDFKEKKLHK